MRVPHTLVALTAAVAALGTTAEAKAPTLKTELEKVSYIIGHNIGSDLKRQGLELNPTLMGQAIADALAGKPSLVSPEETQKVMASFQESMRKKSEEKSKVDSDKNKNEGKKFLEDNKKNKDVKVTASGLQYQVLKEGNGPKPKETDTVTVHYKGTLINGKEFDSSYKRNEPTSFPLNGVIKGWTEGVQLMTVGSKYKFVIPSELAYGTRGAPPDIGPDSTLIFEVELISIGGKK